MATQKVTELQSKTVHLTAEVRLEEFERRLAVALRRILAEASHNKEVTTTKKELDGPGN